MLSAEGLHHPCTHNQTDVEVQLHRFSTVLDVVNRVVGIRRTSCTRVDSKSVSDCVVPSRSDRECLETGRYRLLNVFQHLRTHWHLYLLSDFITHSSCRQGRNHRPFDKEQTLFLVQLCVATFRHDRRFSEPFRAVQDEDTQGSKNCVFWRATRDTSLSIASVRTQTAKNSTVRSVLHTQHK